MFANYLIPLGLFFFTILNYALALAGVVLFYVYFTHASGCGLQKFFISFNLILSVVMSVLSILPAIQEGIVMPKVLAN